MTLDLPLKVSCVIPTHRRGAFLREAIVSAQNQTRKPAEIIVVSDIDDDEAAAICSSLSSSGHAPVRFVVRREGPNGASGSRNLGMRLAQFELVAFLDDDDKWEVSFLEECVSTMVNSQADLAVSWITEFSDEHSKPGHSIRPGLAAADVLAINPGITGSNFVVKTEVARGLQGFDENLPVKNDTDFFARFMRSGHVYAVVEKRLVLQRKHRMGQLTAVNERRARGTELYVEKHLPYLSRSDRRELRQLVHRIRSRSSESLVARAYHLVWVGVLYGPVGLVRKIARGREREVYEVGSSNDGN